MRMKQIVEDIDLWITPEETAGGLEAVSQFN
jgi:hypothetical protein